MNWLAETRNVRVLITGLLGLALASLMANGQTTQIPSASPALTAKRQSAIKRDYLAGEAALNAGDLDAAEASFKEVLNLDPRSPGAYSNLGTIYIDRKSTRLNSSHIPL